MTVMEKLSIKQRMVKLATTNLSKSTFSNDLDRPEVIKAKLGPSETQKGRLLAAKVL